MRHESPFRNRREGYNEVSLFEKNRWGRGGIAVVERWRCEVGGNSTKYLSLATS